MTNKQKANRVAGKELLKLLAKHYGEDSTEKVEFLATATGWVAGVSISDKQLEHTAKQSISAAFNAGFKQGLIANPVLGNNPTHAGLILTDKEN
jgi:hypothetical protein